MKLTRRLANSIVATARAEDKGTPRAPRHVAPDAHAALLAAGYVAVDEHGLLHATREGREAAARYNAQRDRANAKARARRRNRGPFRAGPGVPNWLADMMNDGIPDSD
jgi:hypothetical protein